MLSSWRDFQHCKVPVVKGRVEEILRRVHGPKVLEIGCNEGFVSKAIMEEIGCSVVAVDNRDEAIIACRHTFGIDALKADASALPFPDGEFDTVVMGEILEHVTDPGKVFSEALRVSKGHVVVSLPVGKYWLGEPSHLWQINGSMIEHDSGAKTNFFKHSFVMEFRKVRKILASGEIETMNEGYEDR